MHADREAAPLLTRRRRRGELSRVPSGPQRDRLAARQEARLGALEEQAADLAQLPPPPRVRPPRPARLD
jgi:hypothetical protein